jgi:DNA-damage-inducible protein D
MSNLNAKEYKTFEGIKHINTDSVEFWFARELSSVLYVILPVKMIPL